MRRLRRWVHQGAGVAIAAVVFAGTGAAALVAHGNLPATKRFVAHVTTRALEPLFSGRIVVKSIDQLSFSGVEIAEAEVLDPWGRPVLSAKGVHARTSLPRLAWSLLSPSSTLAIHIDRVDVDEIEVLLDPGPDGRNRVAAAFSPPRAPPTTAPSRPPAPGRRFDVRMPVLSVVRAHASGEPVLGLPVDAWGTRVPGRVRVSSDAGVEVDVARFGLGVYALAPLDPRGTVDYHLRVDLQGTTPPKMWASFVGRLAQAPVSASVTLTGDVLEGWIDAAKVSPEQAKSLWPGMPLTEPATVRVVAKGPVSELDVDARAVVGPGEIVVDGKVHAKPLRAEAHVTLRDLDPRSFDPRAPMASVSVEGDVRLSLVDDRPVVELDVISAPLTLLGEFVPGLAVKARLHDRWLQGTATIFEPGMPTTAKFSIEPGGVYNLEAEAFAQDLVAVPRLGRRVRGTARATATARMDAAGVEVKFDALAGHLGVGEAQIGAAHVRGRVAGPLARLYLDAQADLGGLVASGVRVASASVRATGAPLAPHVTATLKDPRWDELTLAATVAVGRRVRISDLSGKLTRADALTDFRAKAIDAKPGAIALEGVELALSTRSSPEDKERTRTGRATGSLVLSNGGLRGDLVGELDLGRVSSLGGLPFTDGSARFALHMAEGDGQSGTVQLDWKDVKIFPTPFLLSGSLHASLDHGATTGALAVDARDEERSLGDARVSFRGLLAGPLLAPSSWREATGAVTLDEAKIDLGALFQSKFVATARLAVKDLPTLGGIVRASGVLDRRDGASLPDLDVTVTSEGVDVAFTGALAARLPASLRRVRDLDASVSLRASSRAGGDDKTMSLAVKLLDRASAAGDFAQAYVETRGDARTVLADLGALVLGDGAEAARRRVAALPLTARASVSKRSLSEFPAVLRIPGAGGAVFASAIVTGTFGRPTLGAMAHVDGLRAEVPGLEAKALSGDMTVRFDGEQAVVGLALATDARRVVEGKVTTTVSMADWLAGRWSSAWTTDAKLSFEGLAIDSLPMLAARGFGGALHGTVSVTGLHRDPRVDVDLRVERGTLFGADTARATLVGFVTGGASALTASIQQPSKGPDGGAGGRALVTLLPSVVFEDGLLPGWDRTRGQTIAVQALGLDVEPFAQFAAPFLADLRGVVDGELTFTVAPTRGREIDAELWGRMALAQGVIIIPQLGQTFTGGSLRAEAHKGVEGRTVIAVRDLSLSATSGRVKAEGELSFATAALAQALFGPASTSPFALDGHAKVTVDKTEKIPVTFEGVPLGDAHGVVEVSLAVRGESTELWVAVPQLIFDLPDTQARGLQRLPDVPDIGIVDRRYRHGVGHGAHAQPRTVVVRLGIGDALDDLREGRDTAPPGQVSVRRAGLDVQLAGRPIVMVADTVRMTGEVRTVSGRVTALGKPFVVEPGFVRFEGEAIDNPYLGLRARWDSPEGARITAELDGYLKPEPKLVFRSDPPKAESEIFGLLLFGRTNTTATTSQNNAEGVAVGTGVASSVLNTLLDPVEVFGRRLETRVDTTAARGTSLGIATEIRPRLWAQVDVYTGSQQGRQDQDLSALTLDWRFRESWSLRTTLGDRGSSTLELLWTKRY